jgi:hypothetical protein
MLRSSNDWRDDASFFLGKAASFMQRGNGEEEKDTAAITAAVGW